MVKLVETVLWLGQFGHALFLSYTVCNRMISDFKNTPPMEQAQLLHYKNPLRFNKTISGVYDHQSDHMQEIHNISEENQSE